MYNDDGVMTRESGLRWSGYVRMKVDGYKRSRMCKMELPGKRKRQKGRFMHTIIGYGKD